MANNGTIKSGRNIFFILKHSGENRELEIELIFTYQLDLSN